MIAVAAYVTKGSWTALNGVTYGYDPPVTIGEIADFSSRGPRRDGAAKPEIAAPGQGIASARSTDATWQSNLILEDGVHVISQGTSMASPHVAGLVALMFERLGPLSMRAITQRLTSTARVDGFTGGVPNITWGAGKIDALAATGYVVPVLLIEASADQEGDRIEVRFRLSSETGEDPLPIWRKGPGDARRHAMGLTTRGRQRSYTDRSVTADGEYLYWLQIEEIGGSVWVGPARVDFRGSNHLDLQVHPNPFFGTAQIDWSSTTRGARVEIFDITGRVIRTLPVRSDTKSGTLEWDGKDSRGHSVPAGLYLTRIRGDEGSSRVRKLLRLE